MPLGVACALGWLSVICGSRRSCARDGRRSFTIVDAAGVTVEAADGFLRSFEGSGTQRTYAFFLVDHLRWLAREGLAAESVRLEDLIRYMGAAGAKLPVPGERPWRVAPRRPYGARALQVAAACVRGFYLHQCALGVNTALRERAGRPEVAGAG